MKVIKKGKKANNGAKVKKPKKKANDPMLRALTKGGEGREFKSLKAKNLFESVDSKGAEMRGVFGPKGAESAKLIAKSDNTKSPKFRPEPPKKKKSTTDELIEKAEKRERAYNVKKFNEEYEESKKNKKAKNGASMKNVKVVKKAKAGAKLKMVKGPDGKMVPFYAADGKGKMEYGGALKKMKAMYGSKVKMAKHGTKVKMAKNGSKMKMAGKGAYMKK